MASDSKKVEETSSVTKKVTKKTTKKTTKKVTKTVAKSVTRKKAVKYAMRIKFKSYDLRIIDSVTAKVFNLLIKSQAKVKGPIPLPRKKKIYTVLKAPFVYKDAREQYERITYSRIIDVVSLGEKTIEFLKNLQVPVGVSVTIDTD